MVPVTSVQLGPLVAGAAYRPQDPARFSSAWRRNLDQAIVKGMLLLRHHVGRGGEPLPVPKELAALWHGERVVIPSDSPLQSIALGLVLDGVVAIQTAEGPLAGPAAAVLLGLAAPEKVAGNPTMELSVAALRLASRAPYADLDRLTATLYFFGRLPLTPGLRRRTPDAKAVFRYLGLDRIDHVEEAARRFEPVSLSPGWFFWRSAELERTRGRWKLYVCAKLEALIERLPELVAALARAEALAFKISATAHGLCRPDRMVAYFDNEGAMRAAATRLLPLLQDSPAEPVPFSVPLDSEARLSFGKDPARGSIDWLEGQSWRLWLCGRLARAIAASSDQSETAFPPWRFALLRAMTLGLDPTTFEFSRRGTNEH